MRHGDDLPGGGQDFPVNEATETWMIHRIENQRNRNMDKIRYLPCMTAEVPIVILAAAGVICGDFIVGCCLFMMLNFLFAPTLLWNFKLCKQNNDLSFVRLLSLSLMPLLLFLSLYLEKYLGLWITYLLCCIYFIINILISTISKNKLLWNFLLTFALQVFLFILYFSID